MMAPPVVAITGYPCSGKTKTAVDLRKALECAGMEVIIVASRERRIESNEKDIRAHILGSVERALSKKTVVISDHENDLKSMRYQYYCQARARGTSHCVVRVMTSANECREINSRRNSGEKYEKKEFEQMIARYEVPRETDVWDCPLYEATLDHGILNLELLVVYITGCKPVRSSIANTAMGVGLDPDYIWRAERAIKEVVDEIICSIAENRSPNITITGGEICFLTAPTRCLLAKSRAKFSQILRRSAPSDISAVKRSFCEYLAAQL